MKISHGWKQKKVSSADGHRSYTTTNRGAGDTGSKRRRRIVGLVAAFRKETAQARYSRVSYIILQSRSNVKRKIYFYGLSVYRNIMHRLISL